jgi:hypothetical protein
MARHNLGYLHWCNSSTHTERDFYLDEIQAICRQAAAVGFEGLDTYGELSDRYPNAEIFYLAWEAFLWNPQTTIEQFIDQRLGRLYGGAEAARAWTDIIPLVHTRKARENPDNCAKARKLAESARATALPDGRERWDRLIVHLDRHEHVAREAIAERHRREAVARTGEKIAVVSVKASDEDKGKGWLATKAIDGNVDEPDGYWLTQRTSPKQASLELTLAKATRINRVALFHQLNAGHYRSLDYTVSVRVDGVWKPVVQIRDNQQPGWVGHPFETAVADAIRLEITRSAYGNRMGIGEIEVRVAEEPQ